MHWPPVPNPRAGAQRFLGGQQAIAKFGQAIFKGFPIDQLHDHVKAFAFSVVFKIVDLDDVGMPQPGYIAGLALEAIFEFGVIRQEGMQ